MNSNDAKGIAIAVGTLIAGFFVLSIAGCGGGGGGGSENQQGERVPPYAIQAFDVTGTGPDENGQAPIDSAAGGDFVVSWTVQSGNGYNAQLFVSENNVFSQEDIEFFDRFCTGADCGVSDSFADDRTFDNNNVIGCASDRRNEADLTNDLDGLPADGFIIFRSCDASKINCETSAHAAQLR